jgi:Sigma-70, region 4
MRALASLSDEERESVALRFGADLTVPEIAKLTGEASRPSRDASTAGCASCATCSNSGVLPKLVYWLAVLVISLALVVALILFLESRDASELEGARLPALSASV